jgi:hypothetical protein
MAGDVNAHKWLNEQIDLGMYRDFEVRYKATDMMTCQAYPTWSPMV